MAITYPLALPSSMGIEKITLRAANTVALSESPFTFTQQVIKHPGERWEANITVGRATRALAEPWIAFLMSLKGIEGTFLLGDPQGYYSQGTALFTPGSPLVKGAGQLGNSIIIDGLPVSTTGYLKAGDYIQTRNGSSATLHKVLTDINTNGAGEATIDIWPSLRTSPADNSVIAVNGAKGNFRLRSNLNEWTINYDNSYSINFDCIEAS